jgi:hypothetical protein
MNLFDKATRSLNVFERSAIVLALLISTWLVMSKVEGQPSKTFFFGIAFTFIALTAEIFDPTSRARVWGLTLLSVGLMFLLPMFFPNRYDFGWSPTIMITLGLLFAFPGGIITLLGVIRTFQTYSPAEAFVRCIATFGTLTSFSIAIADAVRP